MTSVPTLPRMTDSELFEPTSRGHPTAEEFRAACESSPAWTGVSREALEAFAAAHDVVFVPGGEQLIAQGRQHDFAYGVVFGRLRMVRRDPAGRPIWASDFRRGDDVGTGLLVSEEAPIYELYAVRDSLLLRISRGDFERLAPQHPEVLVNVVRGLVSGAFRSAEGASGDGAAEIVNVVVLPVSSHPRLSDVVPALAGAAPEGVSVAQLTEAEVREALGVSEGEAGHDDPERLMTWLDKPKGQCSRKKNKRRAAEHHRNEPNLIHRPADQWRQQKRTHTRALVDSPNRRASMTLARRRKKNIKNIK